MATSLQQPLTSVPKVSTVERFDCVYYNLFCGYPSVNLPHNHGSTHSASWRGAVKETIYPLGFFFHGWLTLFFTWQDSTLKITSVVLPVHERAVRNCPWVSLLWQNYLRALVQQLSLFKQNVFFVLSPIVQ